MCVASEFDVSHSRLLSVISCCGAGPFLVILTGSPGCVFQGQWSMAFVGRNLGTEALPKSELIAFLRSNTDSAFLRRWKLMGSSKNIRKCRNCSQLVAAYKVRQELKLVTASS